jgi:hypothetical protein
LLTEQPNTAEHEDSVARLAKLMVPVVLDAIAGALAKGIPLAHGSDPLSSERYVHLADKLSQVAERLYELGERSRLRAEDIRRYGK